MAGLTMSKSNNCFNCLNVEGTLFGAKCNHHKLFLTDPRMMTVIKEDCCCSHAPIETRVQKADWMQKHMPEALDMMRQGVKNGLTFNEPQNLKLKVRPL